MRGLSLVSVLSLSLILVTAAACSTVPEEEPGVDEHPLSTTVTDGVATFYDADGSGNCSFDRSLQPAESGDLDVVALADPEYARSAACGACLRVTGPKGVVTVRVVDSCPTCAEGGVTMDLSASAFAKIAEPSKGRIDVRWQAVSCDTSGNVAYHFKDGSSRYWTAIQVKNHKVPIAKLEYRRGDAHVTMKRESYNYFVEERGVGEQPKGLVVRVTATDGQSFEDTLPATITEGATVEGTHQFR